jgi:hypothetical protein
MTQPGTDWQMPSLISHDAALARAAEHLADQYKGVFSRETFLRYLDDSSALLAATATITGHLPNLAIRFAPTGSPPSPATRAPPRPASPKCCSSAPTTPADHK